MPQPPPLRPPRRPLPINIPPRIIIINHPNKRRLEATLPHRKLREPFLPTQHLKDARDGHHLRPRHTLHLNLFVGEGRRGGEGRGDGVSGGGGDGDGHLEARGDVVDHPRARHFGHDGFDASHLGGGGACEVDFV